MSAHTAGPWKVYWGRGTTYPLGIHNSERNIVTAFGRRAAPDTAANAHLIAAAPELLEALREAEAFLSIAVPEYAADRKVAINETLPAIRAAIAKAEGK